MSNIRIVLPSLAVIGVVDTDYFPDTESLVRAKLLSEQADGVHPMPTPFFNRTGRLGKVFGEPIKGFSGTANALPLLKEVVQSSMDELDK